MERRHLPGRQLCCDSESRLSLPVSSRPPAWWLWTLTWPLRGTVCVSVAFWGCLNSLLCFVSSQLTVFDCSGEEDPTIHFTELSLMNHLTFRATTWKSSLFSGREESEV